MLGPTLFVLYTVSLIQLVESHGLSLHLYTDDVQVYGSCSPGVQLYISMTAYFSCDQLTCGFDASFICHCLILAFILFIHNVCYSVTLCV